MAAIRLAQALTDEGRPATPAEQQVLARWSSWGAVSDIFDETKENWASEREELRSLLDEDAFTQARRTVLNAHYTDPAYSREMWAALDRLGFTGGEVLEPGAGSGTFIGTAPETARMTGVELDKTTAAIAAGLYPDATIRAESFVDTRFPSGHFDATIGNVPFENVSLYDPVHNAAGHSMHNHFIIKSLALTRPGGFVAVLTSHYTLDAQNPSARREMNALGDLVGAVRLPSGAHRRSAGTEALTDLLIFRRREAGIEPANTIWEQVVPVDVDGTTVKINAYYDWKPENVLGTHHVGTGMYGSETLSVKGDIADTPALLRTALTAITTDATAFGLVATPRSAEAEAARAAYLPAAAHEWDGTITAQADGSFTVVTDGAHQPYAVPRSNAVELRSLLGLRDAASALLTAEATTQEDSPETDELRRSLRGQYETYVAKYGPINRWDAQRTGRVDDEGTDIMARKTPAPIRRLRPDPFSPLVLALERFDDATRTAAPAAILTKRVVTQRPPIRGVETPSEAVGASLDQNGRIDLPTIAYLLGQDEETAAEAIKPLTYIDPDTGSYVHAPEYLSGNVREKLESAKLAAIDNPEFARNVDALTEVQPTPLTIEDIRAHIGAVWIDADTHQKFLREILNDPNLTVTNQVSGMWDVKGNRQTIRATSEWGTSRRSAPELAKLIMEQSEIKVTDRVEQFDGKYRDIFNAVETTAAQEMADKMRERFSDWVWEEPERAQRLVTEYNQRFNSIALRDYTGAGEYLTFPGLSAVLTPRSHQRAAVARMLAEPAVGLFHEVGAGKTLEMVIGTMELKRQGLVSKPAVVVPNHMLEQFTREWMQAYPNARLLAASSEDVTKDKRRLFVARAAANDWDAILMTRTAFQSIGTSPETQAAYIDKSVSELRTALANADPSERISVKRLERAVLNAENKMEKTLDMPRDPGVTFEKTGIDYLVVDEFHGYKNLATESNISDARIEGSVRAADMHLKLEWLRETHGDRVATVATATPLANSITEAYVMQRYLRPDLLEKAGIRTFDAWAATFAESTTEMEVAPTGGDNFRQKTRLAKFQNVPEMLRMWHVFADVKTAADLQLPVPLIRMREDGNRAIATIITPPSPELQEYVANIAVRAERIADRKVTPEEDNMLLVSGDGRKAALDLRMVGGAPTSGPTKLKSVADKVYLEWQAAKDNIYTDELTGEPSPVPGALHIVFSDLGTPKKAEWSAYQEIKDQLILRGMPAEKIRFIHEAKSDADKGRLFAEARSGHISVLLGSTEKMGVGCNVQARLASYHGVDIPWRPADVEQRIGRAIRQGNQNAEVALYQYVVEGSFDTYMYQMVERKARFIAQVMRADLTTREIEDIGATQLSAAEAKALASGNPLMLEKATVDNELGRLTRLERAYSRNQSLLSSTKRLELGRITANERDIAALEAALPNTADTSGDNFRMTVNDALYTTRVDAAHAIGQWSARVGIRNLPSYLDRKFGAIGTIGGHTIMATARGDGKDVQLEFSLHGVPRSEISMARDYFLESGTGFITRLEHQAGRLETTISELREATIASQAELEQVEARQGETFKYKDELAAAQKLSAEVNRKLAEQQLASVTAKNAPPPAPTDERSEPPQQTASTPPRRQGRRNPDPNTGPVTGSGHYGPGPSVGR